MKKKILFVCNNLIYGGIPRSLISLLKEIKDDYEIDLMLFWQGGEYISEIPEGVRLIDPEGLLPLLGMPQSVVNRESLPESVLRMGFVGWSRMFSHRGPRRMTFATVPPLKGYDVAVSYAQDNSGKSYAIGCNDYVLEKVEAPVKVAFVHCDFIRYGGNDKVTRQQYRSFDRIACVSKSARKALLNVLPELRSKAYVVENCTDYEGIRCLAEEYIEPIETDSAMSQDVIKPIKTDSAMSQDVEAGRDTSASGALSAAAASAETSTAAASAETSIVSASAAAASAETSAASAASRPLNMITVSRLTAEKGHVRAIEALQDVMKKYKNLTWTIIGDGPCMKDIVYTAEDKGILDRVFLYGAQKNPYPYMKKADFFFLPSIHEAAPMVFGEALALGLPVLTTDTCTAARELEDKNLGIVCANSEAGIKEGLEMICADPSLLEKLKLTAKLARKDNSRQKAQFERMLEGVRRPADEPGGRPADGSMGICPDDWTDRSAGAEEYCEEASFDRGGVPSLSIIVPVYNRSLTVRRCAESLLRQDIKDYEIIFVDDGSDDGTAEVLEEIKNKADGIGRGSIRTENISVGDIGADNISEDNISTDNISEDNISTDNISADNISEDSISSDNIGAGSFDSSGVFPRVKVIHTENGGVAKARNTGLAAAAGRYVTWVDSDDWIEKDILGKILEKADKWEADVILFDGWEVLPGDIHPYSAVEEPFVLGEGRLARAEYLLTKPCPWNKWIRRDILARRHDCPDFRFPEGEIYEDLSIIPSLAMRTDRIYYMKEKVYHYYCSGISIMNQDGWNEDMRNIFRAVRRVQRVLARDFPEEVEYIWWRHLLMNGSRRFLECGRQDMAEKAARWMKKYYPSWRRNQYVRQSSRGARLSAEMLAVKDYAGFRRYCAVSEKIKGLVRR